MPTKTKQHTATSHKKARKRIPSFQSEDAERAFWARADTTDYVDWSKAERLPLPKLKPSTATISLRLPEMMLTEIKTMANARDVPYQSLLKVFLSDRLREERLRIRPLAPQA